MGDHNNILLVNEDLVISYLSFLSIHDISTFLILNKNNNEYKNNHYLSLRLILRDHFNTKINSLKIYDKLNLNHYKFMKKYLSFKKILKYSINFIRYKRRYPQYVFYQDYGFTFAEWVIVNKEKINLDMDWFYKIIMSLQNYKLICRILARIFFTTSNEKDKDELTKLILSKYIKYLDGFLTELQNLKDLRFYDQEVMTND